MGPRPPSEPRPAQRRRQGQVRRSSSTGRRPQNHQCQAVKAGGSSFRRTLAQRSSSRSHGSTAHAHVLPNSKKAIDALGEEDSAVPGWQVELQKANAQAQVVPVEDRIDATTQFEETARKRARAFAEDLSKVEADIHKGESRLDLLRVDVAAAARAKFSHVVLNVKAEMERFRSVVAERTAASAKRNSATYVQASRRVVHSEAVTEVNHMHKELSDSPRTRRHVGATPAANASNTFPTAEEASVLRATVVELRNESVAMMQAAKRADGSGNPDLAAIMSNLIDGAHAELQGCAGQFSSRIGDSAPTPGVV